MLVDLNNGELMVLRTILSIMLDADEFDDNMQLVLRSLLNKLPALEEEDGKADSD